jgi:class 3 adenylate cyclase/pimeloyl-ACP methyl ester carboxylesterase
VTTSGDVRYVRTADGIDIAYTTSGQGPLDVVMIHGFTTHLDFIGESPWHSWWTRRLGERFRVIEFDKRGSGLSDRSLGHGSIEERSRDVLAVMDAVGSERASLVGVSEGGPIALTFAATYPDRAEKLVLYGTFARMLEAADYPFGVPRELSDMFIEWIEQAWGTGEVFGTVFLTHAPDEDGAKRFSAKFERNACTPQMAREILFRNAEIDVRPLLPGVTAPTLVMHTTGDPLVPVEVGRYLADNLPHGEFYERAGDFHCTWDLKEFAPLMDRAMKFLGDETISAPTPDAASTRSIATVLFTDIVGSTDTAAALGDQNWRGVLHEHDRLAGEATRLHGGRVVKTTGDGMLALFDGPSRAINAMHELRKGAVGLGLQLRAGLHTGEVEKTNDDVAGLGVHIAARMMALAGPDQVVASRTVRDLAAGSGIVFTDLGTRVLKGVPGEWDLYAVVD